MWVKLKAWDAGKPKHFAGIVIASIFLLLSALMTHSMVPLSQVNTSTFYGDMGIHVYILAWGAHAILRSPLSYYDPPIFYPEHTMLPGTDGLELIALLLSPVWLFTKNPMLLGNIAIFLSHLFALTSSYIASRSIFRINRPYCILLAAFFAVSSDRFWHSLGHLNLVFSGILPLIFLGIWNSLERPCARNFALLAGFLGLSIYLSLYFFVLGGVTAAAAVILWLTHRLRIPNKRALAGISIAVGCALVIAAPKIFVYHNASERNTQTRNALATAVHYSASIEGYSQPSPPGTHYTSYWYNVLPTVESQQREEDVQFLGYFLILLVLGETTRLISRIVRARFDRWDRLSACALGLSVTLILCSFGPSYSLWDSGISFSPYKVLYYVYLQFSGFYRVPARLAFVVQWLLVLPVGVLFFRLVNLLPRLEQWVALFPALALVYFENAPATRPSQYQPEPLQALEYLNEIDPTSSEPYVYLSYHLGIDAKLCGTSEWRPTVNGWVGSPLGAAFDIRHQQFQDFPTTDTLAWLAANSVHWIVIPDPVMKSRAGSDKRLLEVKDFPDGSLYKLSNPQQLLEQSEAERDARRTLLSKLRGNSAETISWPGTDLFSIVGGDGMKIGPEGLPIFETSETNGISAQVHFGKTMPPGLYDQIIVEYELLTGASTHNTKIYWRSDREDMSEKRGLPGETDAINNSNTRWTTTFNLYLEKDWLEDNAVPRLRLDFYEFNSLQPVTLKIINIKLLRKPEVPAIPII